MYKDVPEQLVCRRTLLRFHKYPLKELSAVVRHVQWQDGVRGLRGNFKDGRHCLKLCPRGALRQHLHDSTAHTPEEEDARFKERQGLGKVRFYQKL